VRQESASFAGKKQPNLLRQQQLCTYFQHRFGVWKNFYTQCKYLHMDAGNYTGARVIT